MLCSTKKNMFVAGIILLFIMVFMSGEAVAQTYKIMPLGDSITKGVIIGNPSDVSGYRDDLQGLLDAESVTYDFVGSLSDGGFPDNNHEGHEGFTADSLSQFVNGWLSQNPDIVILHIGTNDITLAQNNDSTLIEINDIISKIGTSRKIVLCSVIPRWDRTAKNDSTTQLSNWIKNLYFEKLSEGYKIYYAGLNEVFKTYNDWNTSTYYSDGVHLNSNGYNLMARVIYTALMNAIRGTNPNVTDNFNRANLGVTWKADPEYTIVNNELVNQATHDWWDYIATYVNIKNPNQVSIKWGANADSVGIVKGGLVMGLNSPGPNADGYLIWRYGDKLTLYEIRDGEPSQNPPQGHIDQVAAQQNFPRKGDVFKVVMRIDNDKHVFDCYVNGAPDGTLYDYGKRYGASGTFYSGIMVKGKEGLYNNNTDDFTIYGQTDIDPPDEITDLNIPNYGTNTVTLKWTAPGDDGDEGTATGYDIRYSTTLITDLNFNDATPASGAPIPSAAGSQETYVVTGLSPSTTYFFSVKAYDDVPNYSVASNSPSITTKESNMLVDNFNRAELGSDWVADPEISIVGNELANTAGPEGEAWDYMAVFKARANPTEAAFRWSDNADQDGIERGGLALLLDAASPNANGYLAWCRPLSQKISLFTIEAGAPAQLIGQKTVDAQYLPQAGSTFKVATITDEQGHHFIYYVDGQKIGEIIDGPTPMQGNSAINYAGVMLHGNLNNNIDDFGIVNVGGDPARLNMISGNNQTAPAGEPLPDSLVISVTDMNNIPVENVLVEFKVKTGGGSVDLEPPDDNIRIEAEKGSLTGTFQIETDVTAGNEAYIYTNGGDPLSGKVDLDFYVAQEGYYVVWARLRHSQGGFQYYSYFVQVDGQPSVSTQSFNGVWDFYPQQENWIWDVVSERGSGMPANPETDPVEFYLTQGMHRVTIHQRYPDVIHLDKILLTSRETGYTPVGKEEFSQYITNAQGQASAEFTLGTSAGIDNATVEVTVPGYNLSGEPMIFTATTLGDVPTSMVATSQTTQTGIGGKPLSEPFEVQLKDKYGNKAFGYDVTFEVTQGNGHLSNDLTTEVVETDAEGKASTTLTMATDIANNQVTVTFPGLSPVVFNATATSGLAEKVIPVAGDGQSGTVNSTLPTTIRVQVTDNIDEPVANHPVVFTVSEGGGSLQSIPGSAEKVTPGKDEKSAISGTHASTENTVEILSNVDGYAQVRWQLGTTAGINKVVVTSDKGGQPLNGSPIEFTATAVPGDPTSLVEVSGNNQTGAAGMALGLPFVVKVTDNFSNAVSDIEVNFEVQQGDGSLDPSGPWFSDENGLAQVILTLGNVEGVTNIVEATALKDGVPFGNPVTFNASVGSVSEIKLVGQSNFSGSAGWPLDDSLKVKILDNYGNPVGNYPVSWESFGETKGTLNGETEIMVPTDAWGISRVAYECNSLPGITAQVIASSDGLDGSPVIFNIDVADVDALRYIAGNNQSGTVGDQLPMPYRVKVIDTFSKAIPDYPIKFKVISGDGDFNGDSLIIVNTNENKEAEAYLTLGPTPGSNNNTVEVAAYKQGKELLSNSDLDDWSGDKPVDWNFWKSDASIAMSKDQSNARSGSSLRISIGSAGGNANIYYTGLVDVKQNTLYEFSFWARGTASGKGIRGYIKDDKNQFLTPNSTWSPQNQAALNNQTSTSYKKYSIQFKIDAGVSKLSSIYVYAKDANNTVYVDDISLTEVKAESETHVKGSPIMFTASATIGAPDILFPVAGDSQYVVVGNQLESPLVVMVTDKCNNPIVGHDVIFEIKQGGGYLEGTVNLKSITKTTNDSGKAQVFLTVGTTKGEHNNIVEVKANRNGGGLLNNAPVLFYASARPSDADKLQKVAGDMPQNVPVRKQLPEPFMVKVTDRQNNGVEDHPVTFVVKVGGGTFETVEGDSVKTVNTDIDGYASVYFYPGPQAGLTNIVEVRSWNGAPELNGSPQIFSVTPITGNVSPSVSQISASGPVPADGDQKSTIVVTLTDDYGNPISNKAVFINASGSNNTIEQPLAKTDASGRAFGAVASTRAEFKTITAYVLDDQTYLTSSATVEFVNLAAQNLSYRSGTNQQGVFGAALQNPIMARITDKHGNAVYHHPVYFDAYLGGGQIYNMDKELVTVGDPVFTDENGVASVYWVMGATEEVNRARATSPELLGNAEYIATAHSSQATMMNKVAGDNQDGVAGYTLTEHVVTRVTDSNLDPIANYPVTFRVTFGGGSVNSREVITLATDPFGEASIYFTLGREAGINTVEASAGGLSGSPQYFTATGHSGSAAKLVKVTDNEASGIVGGNVNGIAVSVTDIFDNVYTEGYDILFSIVEGNATIVGNPTVTTGPDGRASTSIKLGTTTGEVIVQAYAAGLINNPVKFPVKAKAAAPSQMLIHSGGSQDGTIGRELVYPLDVLVVDSYNNPCPDIGISFVKTGGSGSLLTPQLVYTDEDGIASARLKLGNETGAYQVMAVKNGLSGSPLYFNSNGVVNNFPLFSSLNTQIVSTESQIISFTVSASDADMDPMSFEATNLPSGAAFDALNTRKFSWTPNFTQADEYDIRFKVRDSKGGLDDEVVHVTVNNLNRLPQILNFSPQQASLTGHKDIGETFNFNIQVTDQDQDDEITYEWYFDDLLVSTTENYSLYINHESINIGTHTITVNVNDGYDIVEHSWELDVKVPVELVAFSAEVIERDGIKLSWSTNFEANNVGFNILRSHTLNGRYAQVNDELIPSSEEKVYDYLDRDVQVGETYYYKLEDVSLSGIRTEHEAIKIHVTKPERFELSQNYPNPFNPVTRINYQLPEMTLVTLKVYNLLGREVITLVDDQVEAGYHTAMWNGLDEFGNRVSSGIYYYRLVAGSRVETKKMVLLK